MPPPLSCRELVELVTDYLEDALPGGVRARLELHLDECPDCAAIVRQLEVTIELTGRLSDDELSDQLRTSLVTAFAGWRRC